MKIIPWWNPTKIFRKLEKNNNNYKDCGIYLSIYIYSNVLIRFVLIYKYIYLHKYIDICALCLYFSYTRFKSKLNKKVHQELLPYLFGFGFLGDLLMMYVTPKHFGSRWTFLLSFSKGGAKISFPTHPLPYVLLHLRVSCHWDAFKNKEMHLASI